MTRAAEIDQTNPRPLRDEGNPGFENPPNNPSGNDCNDHEAWLGCSVYDDSTPSVIRNHFEGT